MRGENRCTRRKTCRSKGENQQQTQPTCQHRHSKKTNDKNSESKWWTEAFLWGLVKGEVLKPDDDCMNLKSSFAMMKRWNLSAFKEVKIIIIIIIKYAAIALEFSLLFIYLKRWFSPFFKCYVFSYVSGTVFRFVFFFFQGLPNGNSTNMLSGGCGHACS